MEGNKELYYNQAQVLEIISKVMVQLQKYPDNFASETNSNSMVKGIIAGYFAEQVLDYKNGDYVITMGKHAGRSIGSVYLANASYLQWVMSQETSLNVEQSPMTELARKVSEFNEDLKKYKHKPLIARKPQSFTLTDEMKGILDTMVYSDEVLTFGKHKGRTYGEVYQKDPEYLNYLVTKSTTDGVQKSVYEFIEQLKTSEFPTEVFNKKRKLDTILEELSIN